ncbi:MAG TPA: Pvc16 family protein [Pyrinomonadaceae bacterium]|nr:Pvc16 family protein [Pyrinomonadaceae bacterium]
MALAKTGKAIGAITDAISQRLNSRTGLNVSVGRAEPAPSAAGNRLNIFLYEVVLDGSLKNVPLDEGQPAALWLVLKYLLTAFDSDGKTSESIVAYEHLGAGIRALQELSDFPLTPGLSGTLLEALSDNPEDLKITFDDTTSELLSKVMQGPDEKYRVSIAFQVRPVMIAPADVPSYSLLVGVDYSTTPPTTIGEEGVHIPVLPSMGPIITEISPVTFELGSTVKIFGADLHLSNLSVQLGPVELPVTMQQPDRLEFVVREDLANGSTISAGSLPVSVSQLLPTGRKRQSNLLVGNLVPVLTTATVFGAVQHVAAAPPPVGWSFATIVVTGKLLGATGNDEFYLALFKDGTTVKLFDDLTDTSPAGAPQTQRRFVMQKPDAVPPGQYLVLYRVNGQQARQSAVVDLT